MLPGATRTRRRVRVGMLGALLGLLTVACTNRVPEQRGAMIGSRPADLQQTLSPLDAPAPPVVADVAPAVMPDAQPAPVRRATARVERGPTSVLPDDSAPARPARRAVASGSLGHLEVPSMNLSADFFEGVDQGTLAHGPGHWPDRAMPGHVGNVVLAGHRVTHTHPFRDIDLMKPGDQMVFTTVEGRFVYEMVDSLVVTQRDMWIADPTDGPTVTLFACHPKGSASHRYVVRGRLISAPAPSVRTSQSVAPAPPPPTTTPPPPPDEAPPRRCNHLLCIGG